MAVLLHSAELLRNLKPVSLMPTLNETPKTEVDKSEDRVREMFGQIAPRYDFLNHLLSLGVDRYWRWRTVRRTRPVADIPVLDLCTGTGDLAFAYLEAGQGKTPVVGADFCPEMLTLSRAKAARREDRKLIAPGLITFVEADTMDLPFPSDAFQIVSVAFGLRNVADTDQGLREMTRVCQPGGQIAILEFSTPGWRPFAIVYQWYFRNILPRIGQFLARNKYDAYRYLPESVEQFPSGEALAVKMRAAGLQNISLLPMTFGVATLYLGKKPRLSSNDS